MTQPRFEASREDGRSDAQVLIDLIKDKPAGELVPYEEIRIALSGGTGREITVSKVQRAVNASVRRVLHELRRTFINVRGAGYRVALASEHIWVARGRQRRARRQDRLGFRILQNVRWDEMSPDERAAHEGHLMITSVLCAQVDAIERRQDRQEQAIRRLTERLDVQQG